MATYSNLITFSGLDGCGKTSVAKTLVEIYRIQGIPVDYVWCKLGIHPFSGLTAKIRQKQKRVHDWKPHKLNPLFAYIFLMFHLHQIFWKVLIPLRKNRVVICDRYIYDTLVDLCQEFDISYKQAKKLLHFSWIPNPAHKLFFTLSPEIAFSRKKDTASVEFLEERARFYKEIVKEYQLSIIQAENPLPELIQEITSSLGVYTNAYRIN